MDLERTEQIRREINELGLKGLEGLPIGDTMHFEIRYDATPRFPWREIPRLIKYLETVRVEKKVRGGGGTYFFYVEKDSSRDVNVRWFEDICAQLDDATVYVQWGESDGKKHKENLWVLRMIPTWYRQLGQVKGLKIRQRFHLACFAAARFPFFIEAKKALDTAPDIKCLVTLCDVHTCQALLTEYAKQKGIVTAAASHAVFMDENVSVYYNSRSDYLMLYSDFMAKIAATCAKRPYYRVLGDPRNIGENLNLPLKRNNNHILGVILSYGWYTEENKMMINAAIYCAKNAGWKLKFKRHPIEKKIPVEGLDGLEAEVVTEPGHIKEFISDCDAVCCGASNTLYETVSHMAPTFIVKGGCEYFDDITWNRYGSGEELLSLLDTYIMQDSDIENKMTQLRDELVLVGDIGENYRQFLTEIIKPA